MLRLRLTYILTFIFVISIATPTLTSFSELGYDCTELIDKGEEEENKGEESKLDLEYKIYTSSISAVGLKPSRKHTSLLIEFSYYQNDFVKLFSPPPEVTS